MNVIRRRTGSLGCLGCFSAICMLLFTAVNLALLWWIDPVWFDQMAIWRGPYYPPQPIVEADPQAIAQIRAEQEAEQTPPDPDEKMLVSKIDDLTIRADYTPGKGAKLKTVEGATFDIPPGAIRGEQTVRLTPVAEIAPEHAPKDFVLAGPMYDLRIGDHAKYHFDRPMKITMRYPDWMFTDDMARDLRLATYEDGRWVTLPSRVDPQNHTVSGSVSHATAFAVILLGYAGRSLLMIYNANPVQYLVWYKMFGEATFNRCFSEGRFAIHYYDRRTELTRRSPLDDEDEDEPDVAPGDVPGMKWEPLQDKLYPGILANDGTGRRRLPTMLGKKGDDRSHPRYIIDLWDALETAHDNLAGLGFEVQNNADEYKLLLSEVTDLVEIMGKVRTRYKEAKKKKDEAKRKAEGTDEPVQEEEEKEPWMDEEVEGLLDSMVGMGKDAIVDLLAEWFGERIHVIVRPLGDIEQTALKGPLLVDNDMRIDGKLLDRTDMKYVMSWAAHRALMRRYQGGYYSKLDPLSWRTAEWWNRSTAEYLAHRSAEKVESTSLGQWRYHHVKRKPWFLTTPVIEMSEMDPGYSYAVSTFYRWLEDRRHVDMPGLISDLYGKWTSAPLPELLTRRLDRMLRDATARAAADESAKERMEKLEKERERLKATATKMREKRLAAKQKEVDALLEAMVTADDPAERRALAPKLKAKQQEFTNETAKPLHIPVPRLPAPKERLPKGEGPGPFAEFSLAYYHDSQEKGRPQAAVPASVVNPLLVKSMPELNSTFNFLALQKAGKCQINGYESAEIRMKRWKAAYFPFNAKAIPSARKAKLVVEIEGMVREDLEDKHFGYVGSLAMGKKYRAADAKKLSDIVKPGKTKNTCFFVVDDVGVGNRDGVSFVLGDQRAPTRATETDPYEYELIIRRWPLLAPANLFVDPEEGGNRVSWHEAELKKYSYQHKGKWYAPFKEYRLYRKQVGEAEYPEKPHRVLAMGDGEEILDSLTSADEKKEYVYVVTAVDRLDNESEPSPRPEEDPFVGTWIGSVREPDGMNLKEFSSQFAEEFRQEIVDAENKAIAAGDEGKLDDIRFHKGYLWPTIDFVERLGPLLETAIKLGFPPLEFQIYRKQGEYWFELTAVGAFRLEPGDFPPLQLERVDDPRALRMDPKWLENQSSLVLHSPREGKIRNVEGYIVDFQPPEGDKIRWIFRWKFARIVRSTSATEN